MKFCSLTFAAAGACCIFATTSLFHSSVDAKEGPSSNTSMTNNASHHHLVDNKPTSDDTKSSVLKKTSPHDNVELLVAPHHPNRLLQAGTTSWSLDLLSTGTSTDEWYGGSVALSKAGDRFVTGAYGYVPQGSGESLSGKVEVYDLINGSWTLVKEWFGADGDQFGRKISISDDGKRIAATIPGDNSLPGPSNFDGRVIVWEVTSPGSWTQVGERAFTPGASSVALSGDGKRFVAGSITAGHPYRRVARVYEEIASEWVQVGEIPGATLEESFAVTEVGMSFDGKVFIAGAPYTSSNPNSMPGAGARVYEQDTSSGGWTQVGTDISNPTYTHSSQYGYCADINKDGSVVVLGEPGKNTIEVWEQLIGFSEWVLSYSYTDSSAYRLGYSCAISQNGVTFAAGTLQADYGVVVGKEDTPGNWTIESNIGPESLGSSVSLSGDGHTVGIGNNLVNTMTGKVAIYTRPPPCKDSEFLIQLPTTGGSIIPFFCSQAAILKGFLTCGQILETHCPYTCDKCDEYKCADSEAEIVYDMDRKLVSNCSFLKSLPPQRIAEICQDNEVAETCRATCNICE